MVYGGDFNGKRKRIINRNGQQQFLSWALCHLVTQMGPDIFPGSKGPGDTSHIPDVLIFWRLSGNNGVLNKVGMQHSVYRTVFLQALI